MSELQRLKGLLPPEMQSWVFVESAAAVDSTNTQLCISGGSSPFRRWSSLIATLVLISTHRSEAESPERGKAA